MSKKMKAKIKTKKGSKKRVDPPDEMLEDLACKLSYSALENGIDEVFQLVKDKFPFLTVNEWDQVVVRAIDQWRNCGDNLDEDHPFNNKELQQGLRSAPSPKLLRFQKRRERAISEWFADNPTSPLTY
jgi:hypothetical protein